MSELTNLERFIFNDDDTKPRISITSPVGLHETDDGRLIVSIRVDPDATRETLIAAIPQALELRARLTTHEGLNVRTNNEYRRYLLAHMKNTNASPLQIAEAVNRELAACVMQFAQESRLAQQEAGLPNVQAPHRIGAALALKKARAIMIDLGMNQDAIQAMLEAAIQQVQNGKEPFESDVPFSAENIRSLLRP